MQVCPRCLAQYPDEVRVCKADGQTLVPEATLKSADPDLLPGTQVGEYLIEEKIGEGGFGSVYRAVHPVIGKSAAIKVLSSHRSANPQMVARFISEARAVNQIGHPNIVDIFAFGQTEDGRRYYVMELLEGMPLERYLRMTGAIPPKVALPLLRGIARALDAAHAAGIAHRDLKPENLFVSMRKDGVATIKLLDFGIAKLFSDTEPGAPKTRTGAPMGTPHYMSPEQCRGRQVDHRTDVYSFGIVLHRVLTGKLPFDSEDALDLLNAQVSKPPPRMSSVLHSLPEALDEPVLRMLQKDPDKRPASVGAAMEALIDAAVGAGILDISQKTPDTEGLLLVTPAIRLDPKGNVRFGSSKDLSSDTTLAEAPSESIKPPPSVGSGTAWQKRTEEARTASRRRWLVPATLVAAVVAVAAVGLHFRSHEQTPSRSAAAAAASPSTAPTTTSAVTSSAATASAATASAATSTAVISSAATASAATTLPADVMLTVSSAPPGTKVYLGDTLLGTAPGPLRLGRSSERVMLRFLADGYTPVEVEVIPDADRTISVELTRVQASTLRPTPPPVRPKQTPKDLEPFN